MRDRFDRYLFAKRVVRSVIERRGFQFVKGPTLHQFLRDREVDLVVDVGANAGQYSRSLRRWGYDGDILAIEPVGATFVQLAARFAGDRAFTPLRTALGGSPGEATIHVADDSVSSSIKATTPLAERFDARAATVRTEVVPVATLDSLDAIHAHRAVFVKIDTQGFEQEVLAGASATLQRCVGVQLELPVDHLYEGVWDLPEAVSFMTAHGFTLAQVRPTNPKHDDPVAAVEFDCVFRRTDARPLRPIL